MRIISGIAALILTACAGGSDGSGSGAGGSGASTGGGNGTGGGSSGGGSGTGGTGCGTPAPLPQEGGCTVFTADDAWNRNVTCDPVDAAWTTKLYANATLQFLHPDFGNGFGIPYNVVPATQPALPMTFGYASESDPGPYPFPGLTAKIEGGSPTSCSGDCHVLAVQEGTCLLYEGYACSFTSSPDQWDCGSGAKFDLSQNSYGQRPLGWTSADAAGLSIFAGLVRYAEVAAGAVNHAIRFTMHCTQDGYVAPASHQAVPNACPAISTAQLQADYPPMGLRIRLRSSYDLSALGPQSRIVAQAMKDYGMILADNGSDYYFQGDDDPGWDNSDLDGLKGIPGDQFEVLVMGQIGR